MLHEKLAGVPIDASYNNNPPHHGSHGDLYHFKRESFSERASNPLGETFERSTGIFNSRQINHGNVHY